MEEIQAQKEYECAYDHDWDEANNHRTNDQHTTGSDSQDHSSHAAIASTSHEEYGVSIDQIVLEDLNEQSPLEHCMNVGTYLYATTEARDSIRIAVCL